MGSRGGTGGPAVLPCCDRSVFICARLWLIAFPGFLPFASFAAKLPLRPLRLVFGVFRSVLISVNLRRRVLTFPISGHLPRPAVEGYPHPTYPIKQKT